MTEFVSNNILSTTTGITSFFAIYKQQPCYKILAYLTVPQPTPEVLKDYAERISLLDKYL